MMIVNESKKLDPTYVSTNEASETLIDALRVVQYAVYDLKAFELQESLKVTLSEERISRALSLITRVKE